MPQLKRHGQWASEIKWVRPAELYGEGNFTVFKNIGPNDII